MIVLDLDGPVLDTRWRHYECYRSILARAGDEPLAQDRYWQLKRQGATRIEVLAASGSERLDDAFRVEWLDSIESEASLRLDVLQPGAMEVLAAWSRQGLSPTLVTARRDEDALGAQLDRFGLSAHLARVVRTPFADTGQLKAEALRRVVPDGPFVLWIGDTEVDIDAARRIGCHAVAVSGGLRDHDHLERLAPWLLVRDLPEVAAHVAVVDALDDRTRMASSRS